MYVGMAKQEWQSIVFEREWLMTKLGPYLLGPNDTPENGIYQGDARVLAEAIPDESIDVALFDPPYGISWHCARRSATEQFAIIQGDDKINTEWLSELARVMKPIAAAIIFTRWDVMHEWKVAIEHVGLTIKNCLVWDKGFHGCGDLFGAFAPQHEMALFATTNGFKINKRLPDIIRVNRVNPNKIVHPAQKPVGLMLHLLKVVTHHDDIVIDWFAGSGTVPVACKMLGRQYLAFEIESEICKLARKRVQNTLSPLFIQQEEQLELMES